MPETRVSGEVFGMLLPGSVRPETGVAESK